MHQLNSEGLITLERKVELLPYKPRVLPNVAAIYMIVNIINDKFYIGSAVNVRQRITLHLSHLNRNIHDNKHLQAAWNKYGKENFIYLVLEICWLSDLEFKEQFWMNLLKANNPEIGYNIRKIANSNQGHRWTEEAKLNLSNIKKGKPRSEETKEKLRQANLGKKQSAETAAKRSVALKGRTYTEEHKARMSSSMKGKKRSDEAKLNMSKARKGVRLSEESKANMRQAHLLRWQRIRDAKQ